MDKFYWNSFVIDKNGRNHNINGWNRLFLNIIIETYYLKCAMEKAYNDNVYENKQFLIESYTKETGKD